MYGTQHPQQQQQPNLNPLAKDHESFSNTAQSSFSLSLPTLTNSSKNLLSNMDKHKETALRLKNRLEKHLIVTVPAMQKTELMFYSLPQEKPISILVHCSVQK